MVFMSSCFQGHILPSMSNQKLNLKLYVNKSCKGNDKALGRLGFDCQNIIKLLTGYSSKTAKQQILILEKLKSINIKLFCLKMALKKNRVQSLLLFSTIKKLSSVLVMFLLKLPKTAQFTVKWIIRLFIIYNHRPLYLVHLATTVSDTLLPSELP